MNRKELRAIAKLYAPKNSKKNANILKRMFLRLEECSKHTEANLKYADFGCHCAILLESLIDSIEKDEQKGIKGDR
jgi:hypothetical protein